jgi:hypothetical protein
MIHDLDLVLTLDSSKLVQVDAVGIPVLTPRVDIANARLRFASGLIANLTASRVSAERVRKFRAFSPRTYVSADFATREAQVYRLRASAQGDCRRSRSSNPPERGRSPCAGSFRPSSPPFTTVGPGDGPRWPPGPGSGLAGHRSHGDERSDA